MKLEVIVAGPQCNDSRPDPDFQAAAVEMLWQEEVAGAVGAVADDGLRCLLFKGTPLAYTLYRSPWLRARCDTDILFPDALSAERAWAVLEGRGYRRMATSGGELLSCQFPCTRSLPGGGDHMFDVHWGTSNHPELRVLSFEQMWADAVAVPALGPHARMPCLEHALVLACLHRIGHAAQGEENRPAWLHDIHLLVGALDGGQWQRFLELVRATGTGPACRDGILKARAAFDTELDAEREAKLEEMADWGDAGALQRRTLLQRDLANLRAQPGVRARLQLLREHLFPPAGYMMQKYDLHSRWTLPWYYLRRMAGGLLRRL